MQVHPAGIQVDTGSVDKSEKTWYPRSELTNRFRPMLFQVHSWRRVPHHASLLSTGPSATWAGPLGDAEDDELGWLHHRHADLRDHLPQVPHLRRVRLPIALHIERLLRRCPKQRYVLMTLRHLWQEISVELMCGRALQL